MVPLQVERLGLIDYQEALAYQERLVEERKKDQTCDRLLLLQHPNVITLGRQASERFLRHSPEDLAKLGFPVAQAGRGGEVTFHGPGQLVSYPILKLREHERDLHKYLRSLEEVAIGVCHDFGLQGARVEGRTGVWIGQQKIAAIGVRARSWVTFHGIAFNRTTELDGFDLIVPCGLSDAGVTSLESLLGKAPSLADLESSFVRNFCAVFTRARI